MATLRARSDRGSARSGAWSSMGYGGNQDRDDGNVYGRAGSVNSRKVPPSPPGSGGGSASDLGLEVGDRVTHDKFGLGKVVALEGGGASAAAKVDFGAEGVKRLLLRFNPVEKL